MTQTYDEHWIGQYTIGRVCIVDTLSYRGVGHIVGFSVDDSKEVTIAVKVPSKYTPCGDTKCFYVDDIKLL
jgi:hypothetical protein